MTLGRRRASVAVLFAAGLVPFVVIACKPDEPIILDAAPPPRSAEATATTAGITTTAAPLATQRDQLSREACADTVDRLSRSYAAALGTVSRTCASTSDCVETLSPCNYAAAAVARSGMDAFQREVRSVSDECSGLRRRGCFAPMPSSAPHEVKCEGGACVLAPLGVIRR
jgi:hypothetical protein